MCGRGVLVVDGERHLSQSAKRAATARPCGRASKLCEGRGLPEGGRPIQNAGLCWCQQGINKCWSHRRAGTAVRANITATWLDFQAFFPCASRLCCCGKVYRPRHTSQVGNVFIKGISGGQKRRTSIGVELVIQRKILFLGMPRQRLPR